MNLHLCNSKKLPLSQAVIVLTIILGGVGRGDCDDVRMSQIFLGRDVVTNPLLDLLDFRKASLCSSIKDDVAIQFNRLEREVIL